MGLSMEKTDQKTVLRYSPKELMFGVLFSENTRNCWWFYSFISILKTLKELGKLGATQFKA